MSVVDRIRLEKFCFMFDLYLSVKYTSVFLIVLWIIYAIGVLASHGNVGSIIWGLIWTLANIVSFLGVIYGMQKTMKTFLLPAVILVPISVVIGVINGIINFITLSIFGGIWVFLNTGVMAYYWVALFSVYNDMGAVTAPAAGAGDSKPQMPA